MIQLTVALPIWNSKKIAWIALEGLCNQKQIYFDWELLIDEEQIGEYFGLEEIKKYVERLADVRCVSIKYYAREKRIPLPQKWHALSKKVCSTSKVFLLQAADCYSEPFRLRSTLDAANEGFDWIQNKRGYFYNVNLKKVIEFNSDTSGIICKTGLNMAIATHLLKKLNNDSWLESGVDSWFFSTTQPKKIKWFEGEFTEGIDIDGLNNISLMRKRYFDTPKAPFVATEKKIESIVPIEILNLLNQIK